jgi:hypothetical protein
MHYTLLGGIMAKWHIYENSDELVLAKTRKAKFVICIPLTDIDHIDKNGVKVEYTRRMNLAREIAQALNKK